MNYRIIHNTTYHYFEQVSLCHNIVRLLPRNTVEQTLKQVVVNIDPLPNILSEYEDFFGNKIIYFTIEQEHKRLSVTVTSEIEKTSSLIPTFNLYNPAWEEIQLELLKPRPEYFEARQYIMETKMTIPDLAISEYASISFSPGRSMFEASRELMQRIYKDFSFQRGFTTIATPLSVVMKERKGVCQDFAHLAIACLRSMGLPARYVSGYIETVSPPGQKKLVGVDASHAWFSVFIPLIGWVDFDPTNNQIPSDRHITVGWGRDYTDVAPLNGIILSSGPHRLSVSVDVRRI
jgi:transglutaminase-like putative cysteine protease